MCVQAGDRETLQVGYTHCSAWVNCPVSKSYPVGVVERGGGSIHLFLQQICDLCMKNVSSRHVLP